MKTLAVLSILIGCWSAFSPNTTAAPPWLNVLPSLINTRPPSRPQKNCGRPSISHPRVIGGRDALPGSWPWQVGLYVRGGFLCGGSLISPTLVVTAAHCIDPGERYDIVLGDHIRNITEGYEQRITASKIIVHPKWDWTYTAPDIALIKLSRPAILLGNYVKPVCLPRQGEQVQPGTKCYITGWGKIRHPGTAHNVLQQAQLPVVSNYECQKKISASNITVSGHKIGNTAICGGQKNSIKSGCHGDSGGPYVCEASGRWVLQGVVSWGSPSCNALDRYTVFTRVAKFRNWIDNESI